jgi:hypothetical protein
MADKHHKKGCDENDHNNCEGSQDAKRTKLWHMYDETKKLIEATRPILERSNKAQGEVKDDIYMTPSVFGRHCSESVTPVDKVGKYVCT